MRWSLLKPELTADMRSTYRRQRSIEEILLAARIEFDPGAPSRRCNQSRTLARAARRPLADAAALGAEPFLIRVAIAGG
jgi:hypothetical protein